MGTWLSHLRIAEILLAQIGGLDEEMVAIGSIGPDSGLPDEKWESFDPPKEVSHFHYLDDRSDCADLDFYRRYLSGVSPAEAPRFSFLLAYFFHLVTDNLWLEQIWRPHKARHAAWFKQDPTTFNQATKRDWYGLDFLYLRDHPGSFFHRVFLDAEYDQNYLDFMSPSAFAHQLGYIKTFYRRTDEAVQALYTRPYDYLSRDQMDRFVAEASADLVAIYQQLFHDGLAVADRPTSLALLSRRSNHLG